MKKTTLVLAIVLLTTFQIKAQSFNTALDYLDFIGEELKMVTKSTWKYTKAVAHSKSDRNIKNKRNTLIKTVEKTIEKIKKAKGFENDEYKNKILKHIQLNESLLKEDYAKIIDMKAISEQSYDAMEAYILAQELADKKMAESQAEYEKNFYAYANKHNINIIESNDDLGKKMELSNNVFNHYNKLHLLFFKVYINEIYLWEAVENNNISAIQQNTNALNQAAKEGLEELKTQKLYKNDKSIINAIESAFNFFINETENKLPQMIDFLILNEDFEKIKTTLDKTPERKRTESQIKAYNDKIKTINKGVVNYNKINKQLNINRKKTLDKLEQVKSNFLSKHIPND